MLFEPVYKNGFNYAAGGRMQDAGDELWVDGGALDALLLSKFDAMSDDEKADFESLLDLLLNQKKTSPCSRADFPIHQESFG